ncbi:MAG: cyclopropane fatty acyl phospholipid synthase, partial [Candidatus Pacebacteria bacterium]|nr:cyclopropane fatty acyl phospholipid synthase [Candidatus Paceibacterota bacterium]
MFRILLERILESADLRIDGDRPCDMHVHDERAFKEIILRGSLGFGESYMRGWWDCDDLEVFFKRLLSARLDRFGKFSPVSAGRYLRDHFTNPASRKRAFETGRAHYDLGNDFFAKMLGASMMYTCAYVPSANRTLDGAQIGKLDMVCRKLKLHPGQRVLDIGCGFGSLAKFAAEHYGVSVTGITVSKEQAEFARELCRDLPVEIKVEDYRDCEGSFDRIVSLGMFEHVEPKHYGDYFACIERCLAPGGIFLLHTIGKEENDISSDPFIRKYVFPQGMIPGRKRLREAIEARFRIVDWHGFGPWRYAWTLREWHRNFSEAWPEL